MTTIATVKGHEKRRNLALESREAMKCSYGIKRMESSLALESREGNTATRSVLAVSKQSKATEPYLFSKLARLSVGIACTRQLCAVESPNSMYIIFPLAPEERP